MRLFALVAIWACLLAPAAEAQMRPKAKAQILNQKQKDKQDKQLKQEQQAETLERFLAMSPQEREDMLQGAPPERRRRILQAVEAIETLSPEERRLLRGRYQAFSNFPAGRRDALRRELQVLRRLTRQQIRRRMASNEIVDNFSQQEIQFLRQVTNQ